MQVVTQKARPKSSRPVSSVFKPLVEKCWDQEPSLRPTMRQLLQQLESMRTRQPASAAEKPRKKSSSMRM